MVRAGTVIVKGAKNTIQVVEDPTTKKLRLEVDPFHLLNRVQKHFTSYIAKLKNTNEVQTRTNFEKEWDRRTQG